MKEMSHRPRSKEKTAVTFHSFEDMARHLLPGIEPLSYRTQQDYIDTHDALDVFFHDLDIQEICKSFDVPVNRIEKIEGFEQYRIELSEHDFQKAGAPVPPKGYGWKGSTARVVLMSVLKVPNWVSYRDVDAIRVATEEPYPGADTEVASTYMPDDFAHGHGVDEIVSDADKRAEYLATRDFTVNEVFVTDTELICTKDCLLDCLRGIIRVTAYQSDRNKNNPDATEKMVGKQLRVYSEALLRGFELQLHDIEGSEKDPLWMNMFWIAVHLDRAYEKGERFAQAFIDELVKHGVIKGPIEAHEYAHIAVNNLYSFTFRNIPPDTYAKERYLLHRSVMRKAA